MSIFSKNKSKATRDLNKNNDNVEDRDSGYVECPNCHKKIKPGRFCPYCGYLLKPYNREELLSKLNDIVSIVESLDRWRETLDNRETQLKQKESQLENKEKSLNSREESLNKFENKLYELQGQLEEKEQALKDRIILLDEREAKLLKLEEELKLKEKRLNELRSKIEKFKVRNEDKIKDDDKHDEANEQANVDNNGKSLGEHDVEEVNAVIDSIDSNTNEGAKHSLQRLFDEVYDKFFGKSKKAPKDNNLKSSNSQQNNNTEPKPVNYDEPMTKKHDTKSIDRDNTRTNNEKRPGRMEDENSQSNQEYKICPNCKAKVDNSVIYCPYCGYHFV